ncbi:MAG: agmatinase family protein [Chloroflexi bacterium]|nr:agmatinase family protein [Chloroflexota bacterium]
MSQRIEKLLPPQLVQSRGETRDYNMMSTWIRPWDYQEELDVGIIGLPQTLSHGFQGTFMGPNAVRETFATFGTRSFDFDVDVADLKVRDVGDVKLHPTSVVETHANFESALADVYKQRPNFIPILLGGHHAVAAPSVRGFKKGHGGFKVGLIDFDAHNDLRDPTYEGPSGGTPFRQLIDQGYVDGRNAVQVGLHGFLSSSVLKEYADKRGLRMVSAREVRARGIIKVVEEAIAQASDGTDAIYISFDMDAIEAALAPGTVAHTPGGLMLGDVFEALHLLGQTPKVMAMDIVEMDPLRDLRGMTPRVGCMMLMSFLAGLHQRKKLYR